MAENTTINGNQKLKLDKIYELSYKLGPAVKTLRFDAESDLDAQEKGQKFVKYIGSLSTSRAIMLGTPKKFAVDIDDEIGRLQKLVDEGRSPIF